MSRIFREAVDCDLICRNPFLGIREEKVGQAEWQYVNPTQYRQLIQACRSLQWRGIIVLAYCCGLSRGEILNLTWLDIDFEKERLRVVRKRPGVGKAGWTPKNKDMRVLPPYPGKF